MSDNDDKPPVRNRPRPQVVVGNRNPRVPNRPPPPLPPLDGQQNNNQQPDPNAPNPNVPNQNPPQNRPPPRLVVGNRNPRRPNQPPPLPPLDDQQNNDQQNNDQQNNDQQNNDQQNNDQQPDPNVPNPNVPNQNPPQNRPPPRLVVGNRNPRMPNQPPRPLPQVPQQNVPQNNNQPPPRVVLGVQIPQDQRDWSVNVLRVLGWSSKQQEHQKLNNDITALLQPGEDEPSEIVNKMQVAFQTLSNTLDQNGVWNSAEEMQASEIKATLAFERMPNKQPRLQTGSANPTFWVDGPPDQVTGETRQYIFKPAMKGSLMTGMASGGEPAREALAGRVSEMLQAYSGLDFNMPLTNVISVDSTRLSSYESPDFAVGIVEGETVSGSLQQFKPSDGDLRANLCTRKGDISPQSCQNVAMLDTIMLNLDRHDGNLLMGKNDTGLIPIDHGLSFPDTKALRSGTIAENIAGEKNAILRLPGSYEPFSQESLEGLDKLDPQVLVGGLKGEVVKMEQLHEGTKGTVPQEALSITELSTRFLKRAAPSLAPAVLQMALASNEKLLDPAFGRDLIEWNNFADQVIQDFAGKAALLKEFWMMPGDERDAIITKLTRDKLMNNKPLEYDWLCRNIELVLSYGRSAVAPQQQPPRQAPPNLDAEGTKEEIRSVLPKIKLDKKKQNEWIETWKQIRRAGGKNAVEQLLLLDPKRSFKTLQEVLDAVKIRNTEQADMEWEQTVGVIARLFPQYRIPDPRTAELARLKEMWETFRRAGGMRAMRDAMQRWPNRPQPADPFSALTVILSPQPDRNAAALKGLDYLDRVVQAEHGLVSQPLEQEIQQLRTDVTTNQVNGDAYQAVADLTDRVIAQVTPAIVSRFLALKPRIALQDQTGYQWKAVEDILTSVQAGKVVAWIPDLQMYEQRFPPQNNDQQNNDQQNNDQQNNDQQNNDQQNNNQQNNDD
jgi:Phosphatidylinositol 3- and 4-kinase